MATPTTATMPASTTQAAERTTRTIAPRVDIFETDQTYVILADMPGVGADGLDVTTERDSLTIRGHVDRPAEEPDYQEFELSDYRRTFALTEDLDASGVTAALKDGVLRIQIPKSQKMQPKKIPVRSE